MNIIKVGIFSDVHLNPGDDLEEFDFSSYSKIVACGDFLNILPYGIKAWRTEEGKKTINSIMKSIGNTPFVYVLGNHEGRKQWVEELFKDYPQVQIMNVYEFYTNNRTFRFRHGHKFALDWKYISGIADDIVVFLTSWNGWLRNIWYKFCRDRGWMPGSEIDREVHLRDAVSEKKFKKYNDKVSDVWKNALKDAHRESNTTLFIGHTHQAMPMGPSEMGCEVVDIGAGYIVDLEIDTERGTYDCSY